MRLQGSTLAALLVSLLATLLPAHAAAGPLDPKIIPAILFSAGRVDSRNDASGVGNGFFLDANYTRTFLNGGVSYKNFGLKDDLANVYVGVGISNILQLQEGLSTQGGLVTRVRHDLNLPALYDFFTGTKRNRYNTSLGTRMTLTFALEHYQNDDRQDNFHIGVGLLY
jgi:hypothetical protein